jgi:hypothetical protein
METKNIIKNKSALLFHQKRIMQYLALTDARFFFAKPSIWIRLPLYQLESIDKI